MYVFAVSLFFVLLLTIATLANGTMMLFNVAVKNADGAFESFRLFAVGVVGLFIFFWGIVAGTHNTAAQTTEPITQALELPDE